MVKLVDEEKLRRLVQTGRERGIVTIGDLRAALPVELMTPAEIAEAVERLEDAGVPVELEGWLSRPAPGRAADAPTAGAAAPSDPTPNTASAAPAAAQRRPAPPVRTPDAAAAPATAARPATALGVALAVLLIVAAVLLLLSIA